MRAFGLASHGDWLISGWSSGELVAWHVDVQKVQNRLQQQVLTEQQKCAEGATAVEEDPDEAENLDCVSFQAHKNAIYAVSVVNDLVFTGADEEIKVWSSPWDKQDGKCVVELRIPQLEGSRKAKSAVAETNGLAILENGAKLVAAAGDSCAYVFDVERGVQVTCLSGHTDYLHAVSAHERTKTVVTGSEDGTCKLWDLRLNADSCVSTFKCGDIVSAVELSSDGNWLAVGGCRKNAGYVSMINMTARVETQTSACRGPSRRIQAISYAEGGLIVGGDSPVMEFWSRNAASHIVNTPTSMSSIYSLETNKTSDLLYVGGSGKLIDVFSAERTHMMSLHV
mmetsp:Transcript_9801/g.17273  ORF Transcript_9801/g.17273 Transcript_9801/m.17273 type:complete len:339 (+) Transcript_9801:174-1190(+)